MALNASKIRYNSSERPDPLEPGTYPARVVQILSLGLQEQRPFKGQEKPPAYEILVTYELLDEFMKDKETGEDLEDKPRWISETLPLFSLESDKAKSTKRYYALDPNSEHRGDWAQLSGTPCMVTVVQNQGKGDNAGKVYENVASISAMRPKEAAKARELVNSAKVFDIDEPDMEVFYSLPQWIQDKMKDNLEFEGSKLEQSISSYKKPEEGDESDNKTDDVDGSSTPDGEDEEEW